jgi:diguanylate cyclase (GGDEF)-like protein
VSQHVLRLFLVFLVLLGSVAHASDRLTLGVFAFRPKPIMIERYQPLADYLSEKLGGTPVELAVLEQEELGDAVAAHRVDLVMTNPSHYLELRSHNNLSGALATLVSTESGQAVSSLGGCIIVRAGRGGIATLRDLKGARIAIAGPRFLGGYQAQAFELLQVGVRVPDDVELLVTGRHDAVVEAVLEGRVDAGFIRTGIIESLVAEGRLDAAQLVVLNPQALAGYPYAVSTRLYPEWPFVALPHVDRSMVRRISAALLGLEPTHPAARAARIAGFSPPLDYLPVETLARTLRLPPFDHAPPFSWRDVWSRYDRFIVALGVVSALVVGLLALLSRRNRQLAQSVAALVEAQRTLQHLAWHDALTGLPNRTLLTDRLRQDMLRGRRKNAFLALAYIDLDGFKAVNDTHGHEVGDQLLVEIARRMRATLREVDTIARLGGDEFAAIFTDLADESASRPLVERLLATISAPISVGGLSLQVSGSIGVSHFPQRGDIDSEQLLRQADHAMYEAKLAGRNRFCVYAGGMVASSGSTEADVPDRPSAVA